MLISVAVATRDHYAALSHCLAALDSQTLARDAYEIIVVDNTPDRAAADQQAGLHGGIAGLRWIHEKLPGAAHARNVAMWQARAPLLAFIDDAVLASPGWLAAKVAAFAALGEAVHVVGGPVRPLWSGARPTWLADGLLGYLSVIDRGDRLRVLGPEEWVAGANVTYRTAKLRAVGGFSPAFGRAGSGAELLSTEETELATKLRAAGGETGWAPEAVVDHRIDVTRLDHRWFRRRAVWQAMSDYLSHPEHFRRHFAPSWTEAANYLGFEHRTDPLRALAADQPDAAMFHWEVSALYHLTLCLLGGLTEPGRPAEPEPG